MTERLPFHFSLSCIGEGNGNPLQCSCLENPRDRGAWWAAVSGVAQSQTRLKRLSSSSCIYLWGLCSRIRRTYSCVSMYMSYKPWRVIFWLNNQCTVIEKRQVSVHVRARVRVYTCVFERDSDRPCPCWGHCHFSPAQRSTAGVSSHLVQIIMWNFHSHMALSFPQWGDALSPWLSHSAPNPIRYSNSILFSNFMLLSKRSSFCWLLFFSK